jgi:hypothetical protein
MALARVVTFEDVGQDRVAEMRQQVEGGEPPEGLPASEVIMLYDGDAQKAIVVVFFENEDDYAKGDEVLSNMDTGDTPGRRSSVTKTEVVARASM